MLNFFGSFVKQYQRGIIMQQANVLFFIKKLLTNDKTYAIMTVE